MRRVLAVTRVAAVYLLLGFVTTWAVAWGLALLPPGRSIAYEYRYSQPRPYVEREYQVTVLRGVGTARRGFRISEADRVEGIGSQHIITYFHDRVGADESSWFEYVWSLDLARGKDWGTGRRLFESDLAEEFVTGADDGRGFPALAFWCSWPTETSNAVPNSHSISLTATPKGGVAIKDLRTTYGPIRRALPYMPIWSGLALNTAFYALVFFVIVRTLRSFRRGRRFARGLCPRCRYDREFDYRLPCPECGDAPCKRTTKAEAV